MGKHLIIIIFQLMFSITNAQVNKNDSIQRTELGLTGGINNASILGYPSNINIGSNNNYLFGITEQYNFNNLFSVKGEIDFERKGFIEMLNIGSIRYPDLFNFNYVRLDYIVLPVMAKLSFGPDHRFFVNAGPYLGYLVGAVSRSSTLDSLGNWHIKTSNASNDYKHFDLGGSVGLGAEIPINYKFRVSLEGRSSFGFLNNGFLFGKAENYALELVLSMRYRLNNIPAQPETR